MDDTHWMQAALAEAQRAFDDEEVPIGCLIVARGRLLAKAHNQMRRLKDPTAHAEILAITQAANALQSERLTDATLYVTIEPCVMCIGAMFWARVERLVFGAADAKAGACGSVIDLTTQERLNHHLSVTRDLLAAECGAVMTAFFAHLREQGKG